MTAYAESSLEFSWGQGLIKIQSVNRRFLDVHLDLPSELKSHEGAIRKIISSRVFRGKVKVQIYLERAGSALETIQVDISLAKELKQAASILAQQLGVEPKDVILSLLPRNDCLVRNEEKFEDEAIYEDVLQLVDTALNHFIEMKAKEGEYLAKDMLSRIQKIKTSIVQIQKYAPNVVKKTRERLLAVLNELIPGGVANEERLLREVALFADRVDIEEELTRLHSHVIQFEDKMNEASESVGKTLEFLLQEMLRETNTVGSKAQEVEVSSEVVSIKTELERIREQLQNVE
ncbi:MAG: YicC/YloC family endoribonuclease [Waddliaceae bacterium]